MLTLMIDEAEKKQMILVLLFHSVLKSNESMYRNIENMDYSLFESICEYLVEKRKQGYLDLCTNMQVANMK